MSTAETRMIAEDSMFLLLALALFIVLPSPWNVIGGLASASFGTFEFLYWQRRMKREEVKTGVENLVGSTGVVTDQLAPLGQIRVLGELWQARSRTNLPPGSRVRVVALDGLTLEVAALDETEAHA
ncbi:MAG: NfeD family protein [Gaiellaceae bacterium]